MDHLRVTGSRFLIPLILEILTGLQTSDNISILRCLLVLFTLLLTLLTVAELALVVLLQLKVG